MRKVVICSIPMHGKMDPAVYACEGTTLKASDRKVFYVINAFLEENLKKGDSVKFVLLTKKSAHGNSERNTELFQKEFSEINESIGAAA